MRTTSIDGINKGFTRAEEARAEVERRVRQVCEGAVKPGVERVRREAGEVKQEYEKEIIRGENYRLRH